LGFGEGAIEDAASVAAASLEARLLHHIALCRTFNEVQHAEWHYCKAADALLDMVRAPPGRPTAARLSAVTVSRHAQ
jgi:hypothetical protein